MNNNTTRNDFFGTVLLLLLVVLFACFFSDGQKNPAKKVSDTEVSTSTHPDRLALTNQTFDLSRAGIPPSFKRQSPEIVPDQLCRRNEQRVVAVKLSTLHRADYLTGPAPLHVYCRQYQLLYPDPDPWPFLG